MQKRPLWLIGLTCFMMLYQIVWLIRVLQLPDNLKSLISLNVQLEIGASILIVIFFTVGFYALILKREWAVRYTIGMCGVVIAIHLTRLTLFTEADYDRQRLPFLVVVLLILCGLLLLPKFVRWIHNSTKGEELV